MSVMTQTPFPSKNGLQLVEGKWFNWNKAPKKYGDDVDCYYSVSFDGCSNPDRGSWGDMVTCLYFPEEQTLKIQGTPFKVPNDEIAEIFCLSMALANGGKIMPLHQKEPTDDYANLLDAACRLLEC